MAPASAGVSCCCLAHALAWLLLPGGATFEGGGSGLESHEIQWAWAQSSLCVHGRPLTVLQFVLGALSLNGFVPALGSPMATAVTARSQT